MLARIQSYAESWARSIKRLRGWRRNLAAFIAGCLTVLALPPFQFWFVPFFTFSIFVLLLDGLSAETPWRAFRSGAAIGWFFGFGYFVLGLYWIGSAFLVEAEIFAWLMPFAVSIMPAGLALFFAVAAGAARMIWRPGVSRLVVLALTFGAAEWLRGHVLTGFPWNSIGYLVAGQELLMQSASVVGVYGLGFFAVIIFTLPVLFVDASEVVSDTAVGQRRSDFRSWHLGGTILLLISAALYGLLRVPAGPVPKVSGANLRIVQPNIPQTEKWRPEKRQWIFSRYLDLSERDGALEKTGLSGVTHLIWPESALPFLLARSDVAKTAISNMLPEGVTLLTGALRMEEGDGANGRIFYNSLFVMGANAHLLSVYDKQHLVPFGEYLPFQKWLEAIGLEQLTRLRGGFASGNGKRLLEIPGLPLASPLICYEIIFSGDVANRDNRPGWLLNVTNDAWFGTSTGPYQHLFQARVRAVEEGLPVVRAANTGVSAVIDPYGRILKMVPLNETGVIDESLPVAAPVTIFAVWGNIITLLMVLLGMIYVSFLFKNEKIL